MGSLAQYGLDALGRLGQRPCLRHTRSRRRPRLRAVVHGRLVDGVFDGWPLSVAPRHRVLRLLLARRLGWAPALLKTRLEQARERLGRRLSARGLAPAAALSVVLIAESAPAAVPLVGQSRRCFARSMIARGHPERMKQLGLPLLE